MIWKSEKRGEEQILPEIPRVLRSLHICGFHAPRLCQDRHKCPHSGASPQKNMKKNLGNFSVLPYINLIYAYAGAPPPAYAPRVCKLHLRVLATLERDKRNFRVRKSDS